MPGPERRRPLLLPLLLAGLALCGATGRPAAGRAEETPSHLPAHAPSHPAERLQAVEKALDQTRGRQAKAAREAATLAAELAGLQGDSVSAAERTQAHEATLSRIEEQLAGLAQDEAAKRELLRRRAGQQVALLMALERLARNPPEALALTPGEPVDQIRSARLLGAAIPQLASEALELKGEVAALQATRTAIAAKRQEMTGERRALGVEQGRLASLIARKQELMQRASRDATAAQQRLQQLSLEAHDLRELIDRLEAERRQREAEARRQAEEQRRQAEEQRRQAERLARLAARTAPHDPAPLAPSMQTPPDAGATAPAPTAGENDPEPAAGAPREQLAAATPPRRLDPPSPKGQRSFADARGRMMMPVSGRLFRRYGENDEYGSASKGLTVTTRPGATVVAPYDGRIEFAGPFRGYGQILIIEHGDGYHSLLAGLGRIDGTVGQWLVAGEPVGAMATDEAPPRLYLELRRNSQPINPLPWLATRDEKVTG